MGVMDNSHSPIHAISDFIEAKLTKWFGSRELEQIFKKLNMMDVNLAGYPPSNLRITWVDPVEAKKDRARVVALFPEKYDFYKKEWLEKVERGVIFIEGPAKVAFKHAFFPRKGEKEEKLIYVEFADMSTEGDSGYLHHRITKSILKSLSPKQFVEIVVNPEQRWASTSFGVDLCVITADNKLILFVRSNQVGVGQGLTTIGLSEAMTKDDVDESKQPSIFSTALRGLQEELGITLKGNEVNAVKLIGLF